MAGGPGATNDVAAVYQRQVLFHVAKGICIRPGGMGSLERGRKVTAVTRGRRTRMPVTAAALDVRPETTFIPPSA